MLSSIRRAPSKDGRVCLSGSIASHSIAPCFGELAFVARFRCGYRKTADAFVRRSGAWIAPRTVSGPF
jgi:hypothetical protein